MAASNVHLKPGPSATQAAFNIDKSPSKYIGMKSPPQDPKDIAKEMFGLYSSSENPNAFYSPLNYGGPFIPFFAQPGQFGVPYENFEPQPAVNSSSSSSDVSPMATHLFPHYAMPIPFPYMLGTQYPPMVNNCGPYDAQGEKDGSAAQNLITPLSVKVLSSSDQAEITGVPETDDACARKNMKGKHYSSSDFSCMCSNNVSSLSSPLKRMKVEDDSVLTERADESISAYFADISANSDEDAEENEEVSSIMSLLLKSKQRQYTPLADMSTKERQDLEQLVGTSDLDSLLNKGLESLTAAKGEQRLGTDVQSPPPTNGKEALETKYIYSEDCAGVTAMDMHDISTKVTSSQEDSYYLPSLDSLLNMGEDTIVTMKAAMSLDIQGVVEIATEEDMQTGASAHSSTTKPDEIQIN